MKTTSINITDIKIDERHRKDFGDLEALGQTIKEDGLLQPVGVTPDNRLVFGHRRLMACRDVLGWTEIPAVMIDIDNLARGEYVENTFRKDLTPSEMFAVISAMRSFSRGGDRRSEQYLKDGKGVTKKEACELAGWKMDKFDDAKKVVENGIPELVQAMDEDKVSLHAAAQIAKETLEIQQEAVKKIGQAKTAAELRGIVGMVKQIKSDLERKEESNALLEIPAASDPVRIFHCPFNQLYEFASLEPESVQCVLSDLSDENEFIDQFSELARFANNVLSPGGIFVCYIGQHRLNEKLRAIDDHLAFRWLGTSRRNGTTHKVKSHKVVSKSTPFVVYSKGEWSPRQEWCDTLEFQSCEPIAEIEQLLENFTQQGDLVVDPCGGIFTTAVACRNLHRNCISCDIDKANVVRGLQRLEQDANHQDGTASMDVDGIEVESAA